MICLSLSHNSASGLAELVELYSARADILELRLDLLPNPSEFDFQTVSALNHPPLIFTNRKASEGGGYRGEERLRIDLLKQAAASGADFVDIEYSTRQDLRTDLLERAKETNTKVIISYHDFEKTPEEMFLLELFKDMSDTGADIAKIVTMAQSPLDFLNFKPVFIESRRRSMPVIAFCMGEKGKFSRIFSLFLGSFLTFASPHSSSNTAPGQIPIEGMKKILELIEPLSSS